MMRTMTTTVSGAAALLTAASLVAPPVGADPDPGSGPGPLAYVIGRCYDPSQAVVERPTSVMYNCDGTSVMENMQWTSWGPDGATGTGLDNSVQCQPDCAQGPHLYNPIVVHAWRPVPADKPGCPDGVLFYTDLTVAYPQGVPPWIKPGTTWSDDGVRIAQYVDVDGMPAVQFTDSGPYSCTPFG
jgi:hypothetical protein